MYDKLLAALAEMKQYLIDNPAIQYGERLHELDARVEHYATRLSLQFPTVEMHLGEHGSREGFCQTPCVHGIVQVMWQQSYGLGDGKPHWQWAIDPSWERYFDRFAALVKVAKQDADSGTTDRHEKPKSHGDERKWPATDVPLDQSTMAFGQAMLAGLDALGATNTTMRTSIVDLGAKHADATKGATLGTPNSIIPRLPEASEYHQMLIDSIESRRLQREETAASQAAPAEPTAMDAVTPAAQSLSKDELQAMIAAIGDENTMAIFSIAQDESKTVDYKLRAIATIDRRFLGWNSPRLATLVGTTDGAVRQTEWWRVDRKRTIEDEKL